MTVRTSFRQTTVSTPRKVPDPGGPLIRTSITGARPPGTQCRRFPAIHLTRQSPFYGPPGHIRSRDGIDLCPSSTANPSRQHSRTHPLARWFAGRTPTCHAQPSVPYSTLSCNSSDTAIAILRACRAHRLARWHRFVSIERREPLQTALQGTSARAMFCRKNPNQPRTAVSALFRAFPQIIWHGNRHSRGLQGTSARAMASICVHRAPRTPPCIAPGYIRSRDGLQDARRRKNTDLS